MLTCRLSHSLFNDPGQQNLGRGTFNRPHGATALCVSVMSEAGCVWDAILLDLQSVGFRHSEGDVASGNEDSHEWDGISSGRVSSEGEGSDGSRADKKRRFEQHRKQHYNMRHSLRM